MHHIVDLERLKPRVGLPTDMGGRVIVLENAFTIMSFLDEWQQGSAQHFAVHICIDSAIHNAQLRFSLGGECPPHHDTTTTTLATS